METMTVDDKRSWGTFSRSTNSSLCPMLVVVLVLIIITLALSGFLVHRSLTAPSGPESNRSRTLRELYPGFFRFPEEQTDFENLPRNFQKATSFVTEPGYNSSAECAVNLPFYPIRASDVTEHHACCKSKGKYNSPDYMVDYGGKTRKMAVFYDNGREARQWFYNETCSQINDCPYNCQCGQRERYVTGVYVKGSSEYDVSWFPLPGCCKCYNN